MADTQRGSWIKKKREQPAALDEVCEVAIILSPSLPNPKDLWLCVLGGGCARWGWDVLDTGKCTLKTLRMGASWPQLVLK